MVYKTIALPLSYKGKRSLRVPSANQALGFNKAGEVSPFGSHSPFTLHTLLNLEDPDISRPSNWGGRDRTCDLDVNSIPLLPLSYTPLFVCRCGGIEPLLLQLPYRGVLTTRLPTAFVW